MWEEKERLSLVTLHFLTVGQFVAMIFNPLITLIQFDKSGLGLTRSTDIAFSQARNYGMYLVSMLLYES